MTAISVSEFVSTHYCGIQVTVMENMGRGGGQRDGFTEEWEGMQSKSAVSKRKALQLSRIDH